ncbi:outer membrane protein [Pseudoxanthomonas wuyuanensis]|uniref:Outer membrane immunogenic protein n=1 Tax=Pseudoxanthomonas wuyuanensis TaxID=1073196 RepID=A0A286DBH3_9GAMM|nr:outer membrane beta-barrel protein [Pseudoxanthomonas wuyuanensis]KAF1721741.1 porin family protein [Pseudoxanthomonas wuyuanensis]SOD55993.1 outer membrane immunogenic protein [Pseudoxanthomonas wuyuanensis]
MNKRLSVFAVACLLSANAAAANGDWTGWYIGGHAGYGNGDSEARIDLGGQWSIESQQLRDHVASSWSTDLDPSGSAYGVQLGYQYQFQNNLVLGMELDYSQLGMDDARRTGLTPVPSIPSLSYDFGNSIELDNKLALRAKLGYVINRHLLFATAGWTRVDAEASAGVVSNGGYNKLGGRSDRVDGVEWGLGYEFDFGNRWSLRAEYLRTDADDLRYDTVYQPGSSFVSPAYTESVRQDVDFSIFRLGVNYRF